jgi:hypothetical protein
MNKLVDALLHPKAHHEPYYWLLDTLGHAMIEQDPKVTATKFVQYSVPKIIQQITKTNHQRKPRRTKHRKSI